MTTHLNTTEKMDREELIDLADSQIRLYKMLGWDKALIYWFRLRKKLKAKKSKRVHFHGCVPRHLREGVMV